MVRCKDDACILPARSEELPVGTRATCRFCGTWHILVQRGRFRTWERRARWR